MKNLITPLVQNIEPVIAIYLFLLLVANITMLIVLPELIDKVITGMMIPINITLLLFWLKIFHNQPKH